MKVESGPVNKPSVQKPSTEKKTEKTQNKTAPSSQSKASSQSTPSNQIKVEDKVQLSDKAQEKLKSEKKEEKSVFQSAYDWITGQGEDSSKLIDEEKQKEFQEKLKKEDPERYKQYMRNQFDADQHIIEAKEKAGDAAQEGLERATDVDTLVKSGLTGADEYALKKQNKEAEEKQMELAKNKDSNKDHVSSLLNSQGEINRANLEVADATQNIADTIDPTLGGAGKLVDAKNKFKNGDYKGAALDTGEAGLRIVTSALLESGKAFEWAGKAGNKVLKLAGPGAKKIFSKGDDILKSVSPKAYKALTESGGSVKKIVNETLEKGGELVNKSLKSVTGKEAKEILEWANKPVSEIASEAGEGIKKKFKGFVDKSGGKVDEMIDGGKEGFKGSKLSDNIEGMEKVPSKEIQSSALDDPKINYIDGKDNRLKKEYDQILDDVESEFENLGMKPDKISSRGDKKILVYGKDKESEWVEDAISELPEGMCWKTSGLEAVYVDDYIYKTEKGELVPGNLGLCKPDYGEIVLNRSNLSQELKDFENVNKGPLLSTTTDIEKKAQLQEKYDNLIESTREKWMDTFYHEVFHQADYDMARAAGLDPKKYKYYSQWGDSPFKLPEAHNISDYAKKVQEPFETASETFRKLMSEKRKLEIDLGSDFSMDKFLKKLKDDPYSKQYEYMINTYFKNSPEEKLIW